MTAFSLLDRDTADFLKPCRLRLVRGSSGPLPDLSDGADRRADIFDDARAGPGAAKLLALMAILDVRQTGLANHALQLPRAPAVSTDASAVWSRMLLASSTPLRSS